MAHPIFPVQDGIVRMKPIGRVRSPVAEARNGGFVTLTAEVEVEPGLQPLLQGTDDFSHLWVLYWMSEVREHSVARRPQGRDDVPVTGMFANR